MSIDSRKLLAEFLGTFILIFLGSLAILSFGGADDLIGLFGIAIGTGTGLLAALYATGEISGGHYNPAVSLAALLDGRIDNLTLAGYVLAQITGSAAASLTVWAVGSRAAVASTITSVGPATSTAIVAEVVLTAIFVMVILKVSASGELSGSAFLAISLTLVAILIAGTPLSGASVNPARSLGPAVVGGVITDLWIYLVFPFVGAVVGWILYRLVTTGAARTN